MGSMCGRNNNPQIYSSFPRPERDWFFSLQVYLVLVRRRVTLRNRTYWCTCRPHGGCEVWRLCRKMVGAYIFRACLQDFLQTVPPSVCFVSFLRLRDRKIGCRTGNRLTLRRARGCDEIVLETIPKPSPCAVEQVLRRVNHTPELLRSRRDTVIVDMYSISELVALGSHNGGQRLRGATSTGQRFRYRRLC